MKSLFAAITLVFALVFTGCVARAIRSSAHGKVISTFISNPPGARIEIDGEYIGKTPITIEWPRSYQDGSRFNDEITIKAFPSGPGQFQQKKFFESHGGTLPIIPAKIYFDMTSPDISKSEE